MIIVENQSELLILGDALVKDVKLAFKKMGKDISFTTKEKAHADPNAQFWIIGLGEPSVSLLNLY